VTAPQPSPVRSIFLTVACAFAAVAALQALAFAFRPETRALAATVGAPWLPGFQLVSAALALVFLVALWTMRRWALWGYLAVIAGQSVVLLRLGVWSPVVLLFPALVAAAAAWSWERLR
jgi:hypothetical protein